MIYCGYFQLNELIDVRPNIGSRYIRSIMEPFTDEMVFDAQRVVNWLDLFGLELYGMTGEEKLHASGHANGSQIVEMLERIHPKTVIPVHTEKPEYLKTRFGNVWVLKYRATYSL